MFECTSCLVFFLKPVVYLHIFQPSTLVVSFAEASGAQEAEPQPLKEPEPRPLVNELEPQPLPNPPHVYVLDSPQSVCLFYACQ